MDDKSKENKSKSVDKTFKDLETDDEKIIWHYQHAEGSIQDIARVYRTSVEHVLEINGLNDMAEVQTQGDLIDQSEAGPEVRVNPLGNPAKAKYTLD